MVPIIFKNNISVLLGFSQRSISIEQDFVERNSIEGDYAFPRIESAITSNALMNPKKLAVACFRRPLWPLSPPSSPS